MMRGKERGTPRTYHKKKRDQLCAYSLTTVSIFKPILYLYNCRIFLENKYKTIALSGRARVCFLSVFDTLEHDIEGFRNVRYIRIYKFLYISQNIFDFCEIYYSYS